MSIPPDIKVPEVFLCLIARCCYTIIVIGAGLIACTVKQQFTALGWVMDDKDQYITEECRQIEDKDYNEFIQIMRAYLPGSDEDMVGRMYEKYREAFVGYFIDGRLAGICFGWPRREQVALDASFQLDGIAIIHPYNARGRGSRLISFFEQRVKGMGYGMITLGSADGYVEGFYMKNGYEPAEYKVLRKDKDAYVHRIPSVSDYYRLDRAEIMKRVDGYHGFIVFRKDL